ncbi:MAG: hypothetical protein Q9213_003583 [Squamulea squamosa]
MENSLQPRPSAAQPETTTTQPSRNVEERLTPATARLIFSLISTAIDRLASTPNARLCQQQCIYAVTKVLKDMLDQICHLAESLPHLPLHKSAKNLNPPTKKPRRSTRLSSQKPSASSHPPPPPQRQRSPAKKTKPTRNLNDDQRLTHLSAFLIAALQTLNYDTNQRPTDRTIHEGWMFFLQQRISETLKSFVFGEDDEDWNAACAGGASDTATATEHAEGCNKRRREERTKKEKQAPYLILFLEHSFHRSQPQNNNNIQTPNLNTPAYNQPGTSPLRTQIQHTIFASIFNHNSTLFNAALLDPCDPRIEIEKWAGIITGEDVVDRFKAEVWRLVGWEGLKEFLE